MVLYFSGHVTGTEMPILPQYVGNFAISNDGTISAIGVLDRETKANYTLDVRASDLDSAHPRHNVTVVEIEVEDSNDNPPVFRNASYVADLKEHSKIGYVTLRVRLFYSLLWERGGVVVSALNFRFEGRRFEAQCCMPLCCFLGQETLLHFVCLHPRV